MTMNDGAPTGNDGSTPAWKAMAKKFQAWRLPVPAVPKVFRPLLETRGDYCWATPGMSGTGADMYRWRPENAEPFLAGQDDDYVAVSHAGHGINSYAIIFHLVYRGLAVFVRKGWGGCYMDVDETTADVADMLEGCRGLLASWEAHGLDADPESRLLCIHLGKRGGACGWAPPAQSGSMTIEDFRRDHALRRAPGPCEAFGHAMRLVEARAATSRTRPDGAGPGGVGPMAERP